MLLIYISGISSVIDGFSYFADAVFNRKYNELINYVYYRFNTCQYMKWFKLAPPLPAATLSFHSNDGSAQRIIYGTLVDFAADST